MGPLPQLRSKLFSRTFSRFGLGRGWRREGEEERGFLKMGSARSARIIEYFQGLSSILTMKFKPG